ncbi:MAG: hypothetical protein ACWA40_07985, partial [Planktomarina sp.]
MYALLFQEDDGADGKARAFATNDVLAASKLVLCWVVMVGAMAQNGPMTDATLWPAVRGRLTFDRPLADLTWLRVGGPADVLFQPADM